MRFTDEEWAKLLTKDPNLLERFNSLSNEELMAMATEQAYAMMDIVAKAATTKKRNTLEVDTQVFQERADFILEYLTTKNEILSNEKNQDGR